jgi:hypothetical protein
VYGKYLYPITEGHRVDCEACPPVDSLSTYLRSPCTHPRSERGLVKAASEVASGKWPRCRFLVLFCRQELHLEKFTAAQFSRNVTYHSFLSSTYCLHLCECKNTFAASKWLERRRAVKKVALHSERSHGLEALDQPVAFRNSGCFLAQVFTQSTCAAS